MLESQTSNISITWEVVRNAGAQATPRPSESKSTFYSDLWVVCKCTQVWEVLAVLCIWIIEWPKIFAEHLVGRVGHDSLDWWSLRLSTSWIRWGKKKKHCSNWLLWKEGHLRILKWRKTVWSLCTMLLPVLSFA